MGNSSHKISSDDISKNILVRLIKLQDYRNKLKNISITPIGRNFFVDKKNEIFAHHKMITNNISLINLLYLNNVSDDSLLLLSKSQYEQVVNAINEDKQKIKNLENKIKELENQISD